MNKCCKLQDSIADVLLFFQDLKVPYKAGNKEIRSLIHILSGVKDFRIEGKTTYRLENLLTICFLLALRGEFHSFSYAATYVRVREEEFVKLGLVEKGKTPSHDTFRRIFTHLDANSLRDVFASKIKVFLNRIAGTAEHNQKKVSILSGDGKTFNGSGRGGRHNYNVFNMYNASSSVCLTSIPLADKDSEIPAFQKLLPKYNLRNTVVTADALHCQRDTCGIIVEKGGEYVFKVKGNQKALMEDIQSKFSDGRSKITVLTHNNCEYSFIKLPKSYIGYEWPGQKTYVKMISHKRDAHKDDAARRPQLFLTSLSDPVLIAEAIDNRWQIEDGLHLFKDNVLKEDACSFTDGNAVKVMATINNTVYSLYRISSAILGDRSMQETIIRFKDDPVSLVSTVLPLLEGRNLTNLIKENARGRKKN